MSLAEKADMATRAVWNKLLNEHKKSGEPIISWKDGKLAFLSPDDLQEVSPVNFAIGEKKSEYNKK
jgi:hypothetical protein